MKTEGILVIDLGTSKAHANLFSLENGALLRNGTVSYDWIRPEEGMAELHAETIWEAAQEAVGIIADGSGDIEIAALTFSFFGAQLVTLDSDRNEVFPVIISFDSRAAAEAAEICQIVPAEQLGCIVRGGINAEANPSKVRWLKKHDPDRFRRIRYVTTIASFLYQKAGLPFCTEPSMIQTLQFHRQDGSLIAELAAACGLSESHFDCPVVEGDRIFGRISRFGRVVFHKEIPVLPGGHDCILSQIGSGVLPGGNGILGDVCGTYDLMGFLVPAASVRNRDAECLNTPAAGTMSFLYGGPAGAQLETSVRTLWGSCSGKLLTGLFENAVFDGEHGGLWAGKDWDGIKKDPASLRIFGEQRVFESLVEEITFALKESYVLLCGKNGGPFSAVRAGGGASRSKSWIQLKADVFQTEFELLENEEVSSLGAAVIAAAAVGKYPDYRTAAEKMVHVSARFLPRYAERYEHLYRQWKAGSV